MRAGLMGFKDDLRHRVMERLGFDADSISAFENVLRDFGKMLVAERIRVCKRCAHWSRYDVYSYGPCELKGDQGDPDWSDEYGTCEEWEAVGS